MLSQIRRPQINFPLTTEYYGNKFVVNVQKRSWGKVMFLQVSVILFTGGGGVGVWPGGSQAHTQGGLQAHTWGCIPACTEADTPWMATAAGGSHPAGMHSCYISNGYDTLNKRDRHIL